MIHSPAQKASNEMQQQQKTNQQKTANAQLTTEKGTEPIAVRTEKPSNNATTMSVFISLPCRSNTTWTLGSRGYCMRVFVGFPLLRPSPKSQRHTSHTPCTGRVQKRDTHTPALPILIGRPLVPIRHAKHAYRCIGIPEPLPFPPRVTLIMLSIKVRSGCCCCIG